MPRWPGPVMALGGALLAIGALTAATLAVASGISAQSSQGAAPSGTAALHAKAQRRLTLRNVMVIYGSARPPFGPVDRRRLHPALIRIHFSAADVPERPEACLSARPNGTRKAGS